ncbi:MAG: GDSL-type esterase/lipase family protein [Myxococcota bacterium]
MTRSFLHILALAMSVPVAALLAATPAAHASEPLQPFFESLQSLESGGSDKLVRIAWWGDSAIIADGYTGEVRALLQERFGDGGPGFILAAPAFDGYLRRGVPMKRQGWEVSNILMGSRSDGRYGYGGVLSTSWGGATTTFTAAGEPFERVEVFYRGGPKAGGLQLFLDGDPKPASELAAGSGGSVADAVWSPEIGSVRQVKVRASGGGLTQVYGVALERKGPGLTLDAIGILGLRARRWQNADAEHLTGQLKKRRPDLLVLNFGGNERVDPGLSAATHADEIAEAIRTFKRGAPTAACLVVGLIVQSGGDGKVDPALKKIYAGQRTAAEREGCAFLDTLALMGGDQALAQAKKQRLIGADGAHLTPKGHAAVGQLMGGWLLKRYDAWRTATASAQPAAP